jgi:ribonuclease HI
VPSRGAFSLYVDGASRGNPGHAGAGALIKDHEGNVIKEFIRYLGMATNNMAEYQALLMGLEGALSIGASRITVFADSELMVRQVKGEYRVKSPALLPMHERAMALIRRFKSFSISHVARERNMEADSLANRAIDEKA